MSYNPYQSQNPPSNTTGSTGAWALAQGAGYYNPANTQYPNAPQPQPQPQPGTYPVPTYPVPTGEFAPMPQAGGSSSVTTSHNESVARYEAKKRELAAEISRLLADRGIHERSGPSQTQAFIKLFKEIEAENAAMKKEIAKHQGQGR